MATRFMVDYRDYGRLAAWWQWFPPAEATLGDRILAEKFYRGQFDPDRTPGQEGHSVALDSTEAGRVRLWWDYIPGVVLDESDEDYAERLDEFMVRYS